MMSHILSILNTNNKGMNDENNSNHSVNRNFIRKPDRELLFVETGKYEYSTDRIGNGGIK